MKIRRSARTIMSTLLVLVVFSLVTVWHNKASHDLSDREAQDLIQRLEHNNPAVVSFFERMNGSNDIIGFYVLGMNSDALLPVNIFRACYRDPLAARTMASRLMSASHDRPILTRYRSLNDFLVILRQNEHEHPGYLNSIEINSHQFIPETALGISMRLVISILLGIIGIAVVKKRS